MTFVFLSELEVAIEKLRSESAQYLLIQRIEDGRVRVACRAKRKALTLVLNRWG